MQKKRINIDDMVVIKKRSYMGEQYAEWIRIATQVKEQLKVVKAIPMKGFLVRSRKGDTYVFNGSDLRVVE